MQFLAWLKRAIREQRATRHSNPNLGAFYWDGGAPEKHLVKNISLTGAYLYAQKAWCVGTVLTVTLQEDLSADGNPATPSFVCVRCSVVRDDGEGVGVKFILETREEREALKQFVKSVAPKGAAAETKVRKQASGQGQALVEYALMVPLLFILVANTVNFGGLLYSWITIANAARAASQDAAMGASYASYPAGPTLSDIKTLVHNETLALTHASMGNPRVTICENVNGTALAFPITTPPVACADPHGIAAPPTDPEAVTDVAGASRYTTVSIDIAYDFAPMISMGLRFPALNLFTVAMPGTVHRRTVMRVLN
jgi:Flp pilus assembly protein TadG